MLLFFAIIFLLSCSTIKNSIQKNHSKTDKLVSILLEENSNAFYLKSSYSNFSTVWFYSNNRIVIFKLSNGKIDSKNDYQNKTQLNSFSKEVIFELDKCIELDGDGFGFKIKNDDNIIQEDLPINVECLKKGKYQSDFLNEVVRDISTYDMWQVKAN